MLYKLGTNTYYEKEMKMHKLKEILILKMLLIVPLKK